MQMLDNLLDIEVAYSLLRGGAQDNENDPIDINYEKLKTKIEVCPIFSGSNNQCGRSGDYERKRQQYVICLFYRLLIRPRGRLRSLRNMLRTPTLLRTTLTLWKCKK